MSMDHKNVNRIQELELTVSELAQVPKEVEGATNRLELRIRRYRKKQAKKAIGITFSTITAACIIFALLVNMSTVFAQQVSNIPILRELAELFTYKKGVQSAIENDYYQELNLVGKDGDITFKIPFVVADEHEIVVFYEMESKEITDDSRINLNIQLYDETTGEDIEGYAVLTTDSGTHEGKEYNVINIYFMERPTPKEFGMRVEVSIDTINSGGVTIENDIVEDTIEEDTIEDGKVSTGSFQFSISLDDFVAPKVYDVKEEYEVEGQKFTIEQVVIYPTGSKITVSADKDNTAYLQGLELELVDETGKVLGSVSGVTSSYDHEGNVDTIFLDSNYFEQPKALTLKVNFVELLPKELKEMLITVNLKDTTMESEVEGISLYQVDRFGEEVEVMFIYDTRKINPNFEWFYMDSKGMEYDIGEMGYTLPDSSYRNDEGIYEEKVENYMRFAHITTKWFEDDVVVFALSPSRKIQLPTPYEVPIIIDKK